MAIGDFWGISQLAPDLDDDLGITIVVARTEKGCRIVQNIPYLREFTFDALKAYNSAIISSPVKPAMRPKFQNDANSKDKLIPVMNKYARRPLTESLYLNLARYKHKILHK